MMRRVVAAAAALCCGGVAMGGSFKLENVVTHKGQPDGSAGVAVGPRHFVAACDEENTLRLFSADSAAASRVLLKLDGPLDLKPNKKGKILECDIEGAARIGDLVFWIGSHGRNKEGEIRENRRLFFATRLKGEGAEVSLALHGKPCRSLLEAMLADERLKPFDLAKAEEEKPEDEGGLNIESLCADGEAVLVGFRNPVGNGALLVPLLNPRAVVEGAGPELGAPVALSLGGLGIRDMAKWNGRFLIVAGDHADKSAPGARPSRLFLWSGARSEKPAPLDGDLAGLNPEAILVHGDGADATVILLSDDGGDSFRSARVKLVADK